LALAQVPLLRMGLRDRRPVAQRCDVVYECFDLPLREKNTRAARLQAEMRQRHVARAQVEVGGARADTAQRRRDGLLLRLLAPGAGADRPRLRDAASVHAVARVAVAPVEMQALRDERAGRRGRRGRQEEERDDEGRAPHDCLHAMSRRFASPSSRTIIRKIAFAATAAALKKWMRVGLRSPSKPSTGGPSPNSKPRVRMNTITAQTSAIAMNVSETPIRVPCHAGLESPHRVRPVALHSACVMPMPARWSVVHTIAPKSSPTHCRTARRRMLRLIPPPPM